MPGPRKILVIEDDRNLRESWRILLTRRGHTVITADDGDTGLECLRSEKPDIAFVDIRMPRMSGYQVARQVRAEGLEVFLVALSGYGQSRDKISATEAGFDAHLTKPATVDEIVEVIASAQTRAAR